MNKTNRIELILLIAIFSSSFLFSVWLLPDLYHVSWGYSLFFVSACYAMFIGLGVVLYGLSLAIKG